VYIGGLNTCLYCAPAPEDAWILTDDVVAIPHPSPFTAFHVVIAPRRHVTAFYDLDVIEQRHVWDVLEVLRQRIAASLPVMGFDVGFHDAGAAEPERHAVVHLLPRVSQARINLPADIEWVALDS